MFLIHCWRPTNCSQSSFITCHQYENEFRNQTLSHIPVPQSLLGLEQHYTRWVFSISTALDHRRRAEPTANVFQQFAEPAARSAALGCAGVEGAPGGRREWPGAPHIPAKDGRTAEAALKRPFRNQVNFFHEVELKYYSLSASCFRNVIAHHAIF